MGIFEIQLKIAEWHSRRELERQMVKKVWHSNDEKIEKEKPTTSKVIVFYLFIILNVVLIFSMIAMWHFADLSALPVLITDIAAQVLTFFIYAKKATSENLIKLNYNKKQDDDDAVG